MERYGDPHGGMAIRGEPLAWLMDSVEEALANPTDECIDWPYATGSHGYGQTTMDGHTWTTHTLSLTLAGRPVSAGKEARHKCGRRICVNPWHLIEGTRGENIADKLLHGTDNRGEKNPHAKLTTQMVLAIRASTESRRVLGERYGVHPARIGHIQRRKGWAWLEDEPLAVADG